MEIVLYPSEILRKKVKKVETFDENLKKTVNEMIKLMRKDNGVGLAGNQAGLDQAIVVLEIEKDDVKVFINPKISHHSNDLCIGEEGCLSFPGIYGDVERYKKITIQYQNLKGEKRKLKANDFLAVALQHEIDHLNGILFIDHLENVNKGESYLKSLLKKSGESIKLYD